MSKCEPVCFQQEAEEGLIVYEEDGVKNTIPYHVKDLEGGIYPQLGDKVLWIGTVCLFEILNTP